MTTVYLDARFALDLAVNYCLLACAVRLEGGTLRRRRLLLAAGLGAGYGVLTLLPGLGLLGHPVGAALAAAGMLLAAYGPSDRLLRRGALFLVLSCAFGGVLVLVSLARGSPAGGGGLLGPSLGMRGILIAAALSYGTLSLALGRQFSRTQAGGGLCALTLTKGENTLRLLALIDTGNTLRDPLTGEGVVVLDCGQAGALLPQLSDVPPQAFQHPVELLARFAGEDLGLRLLPYQAVGVPCGLLLAVRLDEAAWGKQRRANCLAALSPTPLSDGGGYHALVGGEYA